MSKTPRRKMIRPTSPSQLRATPPALSPPCRLIVILPSPVQHPSDVKNVCRRVSGLHGEDGRGKV